MQRHLRAILVALCIATTSCVTTDVAHIADRRLATSEVGVVVCRSAGIAHSHRPLDTPVHARLLRLDDRLTLIRESHEAAWSVAAVSPGRYRLEVLDWQRPDGRVVQFHSPRSESFTVRPNERVEVHVILSDKRGWLYTAFGHVLAGVGIAIVSRHTK